MDLESFLVFSICLELRKLAESHKTINAQNMIPLTGEKRFLFSDSQEKGDA